MIIVPKTRITLPRASAVLLALWRRRSPASGYTLAEVMATLTVLGVLSAMAMTLKPWYENPLADSQTRLAGVVRLARLRAMSTTSTYRVLPDADNPTEKLQVQYAEAGSCEASAKLTAAVLPTDTNLPVDDIEGFSIGDKVKVGTDASSNFVLSINPDSSTLTLGNSVGTDQAVDADVKTLKTWRRDASFDEETLTLQPQITLAAFAGSSSSALSKWSICFDSRGFATIYQGPKILKTGNLNLFLTKASSAEKAKISVYQGGGLEVSKAQ
ncbi:MAG: prepilin-type N-terminal cleavage/methylation domain-containing protein [Cyanobacteriota bacterium]|nr:prepilin-type N-terminal cleavage/methylation domain-containing protein [Cyanobacteriota bacterium]